MRLIRGGAITSELTTVAAYGVLILSAALGLWTLSSALAIGGVLGSLFFAAAFLGLAFDVVDLFRLTSGELSPEDYLVEMAVGLLLEAGLGGLGDVARRLGVGRLADEVIQRVIRQLDELSDGAASRLLRRCTLLVHSVGVVNAQSCIIAEDIVRSGVDVKSLADFDNVAEKYGTDIAKQLLNHKFYSTEKGARERIAKLMLEVSGIKELQNLVRSTARPVRDHWGDAYELQNASNLLKDGFTILDPSKGDFRGVRAIEVEFEVGGFTKDGEPIILTLDPPVQRQYLSIL